jgi:itaconate CoA-transferase
VWLNRGKESIELDIKDAGDRALLARMIAKADVFVQNLAPGAAERAGLGADELRRRHPALIACTISGYAADGPSREMKSYDMLVQAESGLASITGSPDAARRVGVSVCDIAAGMYAFQSIVLALYERTATGKGAALSVSLFDGMADWMTVPLLHHDYGGKAPGRVGLAHPSIAPYAAFATRDGAVVISIQNEREWARFAADILGDASLAREGPFATNDGRVANRAALDAHVAQRFARETTEDLAVKLLAAGIAFGRVNSVADLSRHGDLRRVSVAAPTGPVSMPAPPARRQGDGGGSDIGPVPALGEHTAALRAEFAK